MTKKIVAFRNFTKGLKKRKGRHGLGIQVCAVPNVLFTKLKDVGTILCLYPKTVFFLQADTTSYI